MAAPSTRCLSIPTILFFFLSTVTKGSPTETRISSGNNIPSFSLSLEPSTVTYIPRPYGYVPSGWEGEDQKMSAWGGEFTGTYDPKLSTWEQPYDSGLPDETWDFPKETRTGSPETWGPNYEGPQPTDYEELFPHPNNPESSYWQNYGSVAPPYQTHSREYGEWYEPDYQTKTYCDDDGECRTYMEAIKTLCDDDGQCRTYAEATSGPVETAAPTVEEKQPSDVAVEPTATEPVSEEPISEVRTFYDQSNQPFTITGTPVWSNSSAKVEPTTFTSGNNTATPTSSSSPSSGFAEPTVGQQDVPQVMSNGAGRTLDVPHIALLMIPFAAGVEAWHLNFCNMNLAFRPGV